MSLTTDERPEGHVDAPPRRPGELTARELGRWAWRQLTSMRTALVLLLLLALAAIPGSLIPQQGVDSLKTSRWQDAHPQLTPIYERLGLFSVYNSPWFSAIYLLLMVSLVGCILPRTAVYWRALRADPPPAPRHLTRLPDHATYRTSAPASEVRAAATDWLRQRRYRVAPGDGERMGEVAAERGYLREAGNLLFHISVLIVLVGFSLGALFGYKGGVILVVGNGFSNNLTQYDDFVPGRLFQPSAMEPFSFDVDAFNVEWLTSGPRKGMARAFDAPLTYRTSPGAPDQSYDLRVNHPLRIGGTEVFLIGHGYAPVLTVRDGNGDTVYSGPTIFLPTDQTFRSFGVVKAPDARPTQIGLEGEFYPTVVLDPQTGSYASVFGNTVDPLVSMLVYTGDLGMDAGTPQSVYALDKSRTTMLRKDNGAPFRVDLRPGQTVQLPDGLGSVSLDGIDRWTKIQISRTPGTSIALAGVVLALLGLLGSLFIRPRRVWVRAREEQDGTLVEVAVLDRSGGGEVATVLADLVAALPGAAPPDHDPQQPQDDPKQIEQEDQ